jgi:hypothetical protein
MVPILASPTLFQVFFSVSAPTEETPGGVVSKYRSMFVLLHAALLPGVGIL